MTNPFNKDMTVFPAIGDRKFSSVQSLSYVQLFATPFTAAHQASPSITNSQSLLKLMSIKSVIPSNHLILCHPLLLLPSIFPNIRVLSNESVLRIRSPKYWSFSFNISPSNEQWMVGSPCSPRDSQESSPTPQFESINSSVQELGIFLRSMRPWRGQFLEMKSIKCCASLRLQLPNQFTFSL